ncbi:hypothetical protein ACKWTF_007618 [Chironomus riparius]
MDSAKGDISQKIAFEDCSNQNKKNNEQNEVNDKMNRKEIAQIQNTSLDNGLDPIGIELISASLEQNSNMMSSDTITDMKDNNILKHSNEANLSLKTAELSFDESNVSHPRERMSREMRNLQKSTQDSKVLSNYLNHFDSPRIRLRKTKESNSLANDTEIINDNVSLMIEKEIPLKSGITENDDSDSTTVVRDEIGKKRRRSISRSRTSRTSQRSKSVAVRPKSLSRLLSDEMALTSDKEENQDEDEIDDLTNTIVMNNVKPIENRALNPPPKPGWDSFCFKCHLDNAVLSLACRNCKCSLHRHCARLLLTPIPKNPDDFICADCIEIEKIQQSSLNKYNHPKIDMYTLKEMLITILEKIRNTYPDRECYENEIHFKSAKESNQPLIVTQISLKTIEDRIMNNYYKVSEAFLHDLKQLEHNWTIIDKNKMKSLKNILKFVVTEINEMEACVYCYSNSFVISNWFTIPCKRPHLLIWAKLKGYPYWPAKVMSIDNQKFYADVRFFGAHDRAWVPTAHCLIFSEKDPNKIARASVPNNNRGASKTQKGIADAIKEKDEYIQNIRDKYGFRYANSRELLNAAVFQMQLENQLPNLRKESATVEKFENDSNQKEKLTLKIVKTSDGTQTIEQKNPKNNQERDKHILYRVLSRNEDGYESSDQSRVKTIILKRNVQGDSGKAISKRLNVENSDEYEINLSLPEQNDTTARRKSLRDESKQKKEIKTVNSRSITPDTQLKRKTKIADIDGDTELLQELLPERPSKKIRKHFSNEMPLIVSADSHNIPSGTHEIHLLCERSISVSKPNSNNHSFHRSKSVDKESKKTSNIVRRLSVNSTINRSICEPTIINSNIPVKSHLQLEKSVLQADDNLSLNLKNEPLSDNEIVEREQVTINDIAKLVSEGNNVRKTILISTSDNSNDSFPSKSRARKSFPNSLAITSNRSVDSSLQAPPVRNTNAMVCIPEVFSFNGINSSEKSQSLSNDLDETNGSYAIQRKSAVSLQTYQVNDLPSLIPKPSGVFTSEGNTFCQESGAVSTLFSENAHRMTDYFKSLLIDTISAISSGVSDAQNVLLKLELEKTKQQLHNFKNENQLKFDKLKKEHADEIRILKMSHDEKIQIIQQNSDQDKIKLIAEIRQQCEIEKQRAVESTKREIKRVTWCSNCTKEARFYCCWNTSYCGPSCQKVHWQTHQKYCTNRNSSTVENSVQNSNNCIRQNANSFDTITSVSSLTNSQCIPVSISLPTANLFKNSSLQLTLQSSTLGNCKQIENSCTIKSPAQQTFFQTLTTPTCGIRQHKIPPAVSSTEIKANSSALSFEQSLASNLVVKAIPQNDSSSFRLISTPKNIVVNTTLSSCSSSENLKK